MFRNTPSRGTGRTPASLILSFEPQMDLPSGEKEPHPDFQELKKYNMEYKGKVKPTQIISQTQGVKAGGWGYGVN